MSSRGVEINGSIVTIRDDRIAEFSDNIERAQGLFRIQLGRGHVQGTAQQHSDRLRVIDRETGSSFFPEAEDADGGQIGNSDVTSKLLELCLKVGQGDERAARFLNCYSYLRTFRYATADFGPDASTAFSVIHELTMRKSDQLATKAARFNRPQLFGTRYTDSLIEYVAESLTDPKLPSTKKLVKLGATQTRTLDRLSLLLSAEQETESPDHYSALDKLEYPDTSTKTEIIGESDSIETKPGQKSKKPNFWQGPKIQELVSDIDIAFVKLICHLDFAYNDALDVFSNDLILSALTIGRMAIKERNLYASDKSPAPNLEPLILIEGITPACAPSEGSIGLTPLFFPDRGASVEPAKKFCTSCFYKRPCLNFAVANSINFGIWGGTSERERRRARRERNLLKDQGEANVAINPRYQNTDSEDNASGAA